MSSNRSPLQHDTVLQCLSPLNECFNFWLIDIGLLFMTACESTHTDRDGYR